MKLATTVFFIATVLLLAGWPIFPGSPPDKAASRAVHATWAIHFAEYVTILLICCFVSLVCAFALMQRQRDEFRKEAEKNLTELIEGTLRDHERKNP